MNHRATAGFWQYYHKLPQTIQTLADKQFELLKQNPRHPSLHLKKIGRLWSVRVGLGYRALALTKDKHLYWFWIGSHAAYDKILADRL